MRAFRATVTGVVVGAVYGAVIGGLSGWMGGLGTALMLPGMVLAGLFIGVAALGASVGEPN